MKNLITLSILLIMSGFSIKNKDNKRTYLYSGIYGISYEMEIYQDGKFMYKWQNGLNKGVTSGTWKKEDRFLILNGGTKPQQQKMIVNENSFEKNDSIYFHVTNFNGNPLPMVSLVLSDGNEVITNMQGKAVTVNSAIKKIKINYMALEIPEYEVNNESANHFTFKVLTESNQNVYFENTKVQIKGKKIIIPGNLMSKKTPIKLKLVR